MYRVWEEKKKKEKEVGEEEVFAVPGNDDFKAKKILLKSCTEKKQTGKLLFMKSPHTQWEKECERLEISRDAAVAELHFCQKTINLLSSVEKMF